MEASTYPAFEQYYPVTAAYLNMLLGPYHDALNAADTIDSLIQWVPQVLPESAEELNAAITDNGDVDQGKVIILLTLASILADPENTSVTPWDIASDRNEISTRLFGPASYTVPVVVSNGPNAFQHELTEELAYGIVFGITGDHGFILSIGNAELVRGNFGDKFTEINSGTANYIATIGDENIYFRTTDFVQGIITAGQWTSRDPHAIITQLFQINEQGETVEITF